MHKYIEKILQIKEKLANFFDTVSVISILATGVLLGVVSFFQVRVTSWLGQIPFIDTLIDVSLLAEFEAINEDDVFYKELQVQLSGTITSGDIQKIGVRTDTPDQKTFKITHDDGREEFLTVQRTENVYKLQRMPYDLQRRKLPKESIWPFSWTVRFSDITFSGGKELHLREVKGEQMHEQEEMLRAQQQGINQKERTDIYARWYEAGKRDWYTAWYTQGKKDALRITKPLPKAGEKQATYQEGR